MRRCFVTITDDPLSPVTALLTVAALLPVTGAAGNGEPAMGSALVAEGGSAPSGLVSISGGSDRLLVADQAGVINRIVHEGKQTGTFFLDLRDKPTTVGQGIKERGLLGLTLQPPSKETRKFDVVYRAPRRAEAPPAGDPTGRLNELQAGADASHAESGPERIVVEIDDPAWNHNRGRLAFGAQGLPSWTLKPFSPKEHSDGRLPAFIGVRGEDEDGELSVLTNGANLIHGERGKVFQLVPNLYPL